MSETNPALIVDSGGHTPTALELIYDIVLALCPGAVPGTDVCLAYRQDGDGLTRFIEEAPGTTLRTHGKTVALEVPIISVTVRGNPTDYQAPKDEAIRLRYQIAAKGEYVSRGLRMLDAEPQGTINPLGRDLKNREAFQISFAVMTEPSYT